MDNRLIMIVAAAAGMAYLGSRNPGDVPPSQAAGVIEATRQGAAPAVAPALGNPVPGSLTLITRDPDSHFRAQMLVNGRPIRMMVDSGATSVVLRESDARTAGIIINAASYSASADTAGGQVAVAPVVIERLAIGTIERRDVQAAVVADDKLSQSLLGQSFLGQLNEVKISGNTMQLR